MNRTHSLPPEPDGRVFAPYTCGGLLAEATGLPNDRALGRLVAAWLSGESVLPAWMGLEPGEYVAMMGRHFPSVGAVTPFPEPTTLSQPLADEQADVADLLLRYRRGADRSERWLARIVAAGCLGRDHLWQDLGLRSRGELTALMEDAFPALCALNDRDMKWKKFLYKRLCEETGIYTCRAPSCDACSDFAECFGPEE
ncbi:MAG: nitrogen fixation protein NifQ [Halorhodospira halophila]|uniref:nitrogen fixation protein NifQ n=1 Tax=Halorhodospira TaxID=85108 RepID=UPI0019146D44|nr:MULTISPECIES: nitrogen fixation protein NifQ [Halorhodospira]MBK5937193.1 hydrogenase [Halorhodospira halophila]MBK5942610.1 hydrogenase [Halorhodospira halophila]MCC3751282.1 nitrogen fixation protein NifQ [Halorhodospira halophila]MCG5529036.1 nitrogen fixation protein NifQ [Halorhodospira halophila]MCG5540287.1 nitrogen fixation protein NifQ [Halorhodospira sp. M39old]